MRNKVVIGNWKMNRNFSEAEDLATGIAESIENMDLSTEVVLCPPFPYLELVTDLAEESNIMVGAQNCSNHENGAYTGEVSAEMLASLDVDFCIIGHSERRKYFNETNDILAEKVNLLLKNEISPIYCVGEVIEERNQGKHFEIIEKQIQEGLFHLSAENFEHIIIAYEPVWAIGTGLTATPAQAQEIHAFIRSLVEKKYGTEIAYNTIILYGGSCNAKNALELFSQTDVDGGLIGGAALKKDDFMAIIEAAETTLKED